MAKKLSDREKAAQKAGVSVDYSKSAKQQVKPIAPVKFALPKSIASQTPQAKLMQAQKSQPMYKPLKPGFQGPVYKKPEDTSRVSFGNGESIKSKNMVSYEDAVNPSSAYNLKKKQSDFKSNLSKAKEDAEKAKQEAEQAKKDSGVKGLASKTWDFVKEKSKKFISNPALTVAESLTPKIILNKPKIENGKVAWDKPKETGNLAEAMPQVGIGAFGKAVSASTGRVVNKAIEKGVSPKGINEIIKKGAKNYFATVGKNAVVSGQIRAAGDKKIGQTTVNTGTKLADNISIPKASANVPDMPVGRTIAKQADELPIPRETAPTVKIANESVMPAELRNKVSARPAVPNRPNMAEKVPTTREALPKKNPNKANQLFEDIDETSGKQKVFANVEDGSGKLKKVEVGEFDETGQFKERIHEDGRKISDVLDEDARNLKAGKRGIIKDVNPGDARAAMKQMEKPRKQGLLISTRQRAMQGKKSVMPENTGKKKGLLQKLREARLKEKAYSNSRDENIMMAIEEALPKLKRHNPNRIDVGRMEDADRLENVFKKLASRQRITDSERQGAMETLQRMGVGTKSHYAGAVAGIETDENGKLRIDPMKAGMGVLGMKAAGSSKGILKQARMKKLAEQGLKVEGSAKVGAGSVTQGKKTIDQIQKEALDYSFKKDGRWDMSDNPSDTLGRKYYNERLNELKIENGIKEVNINSSTIKKLAQEVQPGSVREGQKEGESVLDSFLTRSRTPKPGLAEKSLGKPTVQNPRVSPSWVSKLGTSIRETVQDNWVRVKNLQKEVGTEINSKDLTPYQAETLMHGRTQARLDAVKETVSSIDKEIADAEKLLKDTNLRKKIDLYLIAKHAPERNALHGDGAAGMTTSESESVLREIGDSKEVKAIASKIKDLNDKTLDILKDAQVISDDTYNTLRQSYKEHIPLNRIMDDTDLEQYLNGKGLDVKSSGIKRAKGSEREVADVLTNVTANLEQAVVRAEKNRVNLATLKFARDNKALGVFEEIKPKAIGQTFDGKPLLQRVDDPNVLTIMENGKPVHLKIKDEKLAAAFKAVGNEKLPALFNFVGGFTRLYSGLATRFNPEFAFSNKLRDLQEMAAYMASQKGVGFSGAVKTAGRDVVSMADVTAGMLGKNTPGAKLYRQMIEDGGTTGGMALSTRKQLEVDLDDIRRMNRGGIFNARNAGKKMLSAIDSWNGVFEDSTRLSVYKTALDNGMTRDQAAFLAKNSTINFNKKGTGGGIINSLYMFSNASIQGTTKFLASMKDPKVAAAVTATIGSSVWATNKWNDMVDTEWRDKVEKWDRESNLIVALPTAEGAKYITIPVSWGLKPMKVMADYAYDALHGKADEKTGFDVAGNVLGSIWNAYNPVGGSSIGSSIVPTIGDVPYDVATNTKWSGSMIHPPSKEGVPESENFFKNKEGIPSDKSGMFNILSKGTKSLSGATNGEIQINPASLKYAIDSYLSGAGRAVSGTLEVVSSIGSDKDLQTKDTPFLRRFLKEKTPEEVQKSQKYEKKDTLHEELKKLPRDKQPEKIQEYLNSITDEDQRKGAAYSLMQEGFNTKGTSTSEAIIRMKPTYEKVKQLEKEGNEDEAQSIVDNLSDDEYEQYKKVKQSVRTKSTSTMRELLKNDPRKAVEYVRAQDDAEAERLLELMTDEEYAMYQSGK